MAGVRFDDVTIVSDGATGPPPPVGDDDDDLSSLENEFKQEESKLGFSQRPFGPDGTPASRLAGRQPPALPSANDGASGARAVPRRQTEIDSSSDDEKNDLKHGAAPPAGLGSGLAGGHGQPAPAPGRFRPTDLIRGGAGGKGRASSSPRPDRVRTVQASDARGWSGEGLLAGTMVGLAVGAVVTGVTVATGGLAAAFGGLILFGAMLAGGGAGWSIGSWLAGRRQQRTHYDAALESLDRAGERFSEDQKNRLAPVTDSQWRSLLQVSRSEVSDRAARQELREDLVLLVAKHGFEQTAAARDLLSRHVPGSEATDRAGRRELREDVVELVAEHGYAQTAAALDLFHVPRSQEVPGLKYGTTRRIAIDRAGWQMLREQLVFNVARHDHARVAAEKPALVRMAAVGTLRGGPVDLDTLRRSVRGPDGKTLYGPYDGDLEDWIAEGFRSEPLQGFTTVPDSQGLELCSESVGSITRNYKPELTKRTGEKVTLHVPGGWSTREKDIKNLKTIGATLADYVGDRNGDQAAVVKNLSAYLHRPFPMMRLLHNREGEWTHRVGSDDQDDQHDLRVEESQDGKAYVLRYDEGFAITSVSPAAEAMKEEAHGHVKASVAIRVRREDLAVGNRKFEWVQRPRYDLQMTMGPAPRGSGHGVPDSKADS